jgi:hypothetical protein
LSWFRPHHRCAGRQLGSPLKHRLPVRLNFHLFVFLLVCSSVHPSVCPTV